jgi:Lhr-like helicase
VRDGLRAPLPDRVHILYVSPLKALSNDVHRNLGVPLAEIAARAAAAMASRCRASRSASAPATRRWPSANAWPSGRRTSW